MGVRRASSRDLPETRARPGESLSCTPRAIAAVCWRSGRRPNNIRRRSQLRETQAAANRSPRRARDRWCASCIEVHEITGTHVYGADAQPGFAGINTLEVDETLERALQQLRVVEARRLEGTVGV